LSQTWALLPPAAVGAISATPDHGFAPLNVSFTSLVTGNATVVAYNWSFGDGSPNATGQNVSHVFVRSGTYTVQWTATDSVGGQYNASVVIVAAPPVGSINATPTSGPAPLNVSFRSNVSGGASVVSYNWSFGDGSPNGSGQNVSHVFRSSGLFEVRWTATDSIGEQVNATVNISVSSIDRWNDLSAGLSSAPSVRAQTTMTYDPQLGGILLFGGYDPNVAADSDTWLFANGTWTDLNATGALPISPPARWGDTMVWDPLGPYVVMFGGRNTNYGATAFYQDTWTFDATGWHNITAAVAPSPRGWSAMFFDPTNGQVVLFGGTCSCLYGGGWEGYNDTWYLSGTTWRNVSGSFGVAPPPDDFSYSGWDPAANQAILFGGQGSGGSCAEYTATWAFATGWNQTSLTVHPPALVGGGFAFDNIHQDMVLFGGLSDASGGCGSSSGLWTYASGGWSNLTSLIDPSGGAPSGRCCFAMASDPVAGIVVVFAGNTQSGNYQNDTWTFPTAPFLGSVTATATVGLGPFNVTFGSAATGGLGPYELNWSFGDGSPNGTTASLTHEFVNPGTYQVTWHATDAQNRSINRTLSVVVVLPISTSMTVSRLVGEAPMSVDFTAPVTGGLAPFTYHWDFGDGGSSTAANPTHSFGTGVYLATVTVRDSLGETAGAQANLSVHLPMTVDVTPSGALGIAPFALGLTASVVGGVGPYNLSWQFGDGSPSGGNFTALNHTYNQPGAFTTSVTSLDSLGYSKVGSIIVDVAARLTAVPSVVPDHGAAPLIVQYDTTISGGFPGYSERWTFGDGTTGTAGGFHTYLSVGHYLLTVNVTDSASFTTTASAGVDVSAPFTATVAASSVEGDAPFNVSFAAQPIGGTAPFTDAWDFNDGGQGTGPAPSHRYLSAGHFHVVLTSTDALGATAFGSITVLVHPGISVSTLSVSTGTVTAGQTNITFNAAASGGSGVYVFAWTGLPGGCTAGDVSRFSCLPTAVGVFTVGLSVDDSVGGHANRSIGLTVVAAGASGCLDPSCPSPGPSSPAIPLGWIVVGVVAAVVVVAAIVLLLRRRRVPPAPVESVGDPGTEDPQEPSGGPPG
ncbi:MAG TPA: PKD domain-containing protein, partial [Thermoplasmata archaeon]